MSTANLRGFYLQNGDATQFDFVHDANAWAESHARDFRFLHCNNHTHACTASCLKYSKKTTAEKTQLLKGKTTPGCRHNFWRIVALKVKQGIDTVIHRIRRRGKDLVFFPCIATTNSQNEFGLVQVIRNMPFRSPTNDVIPSHLQMQFRFPIYGTGGPRGNRRGHKVFRSAAGGLLPYFHPKLAHATLEKSGSINSRFARGCSQLRLLHHKIPK